MNWRDPFRIGPIINPLSDARVTVRMIREFIETHTLPRRRPARGHVGLNATDEAEMLIDAMRQSSLPYRFLWCQQCNDTRPFSFMKMRADELNNHAAAQLACDACYAVAVTFHDKPKRLEPHRGLEFFLAGLPASPRSAAPVLRSPTPRGPGPHFWASDCLERLFHLHSSSQA